MSWGEQDPVSIRTRLHLPYFAESLLLLPSALLVPRDVIVFSFPFSFSFFLFLFGAFNSVNLEGVWQVHGLIIIINNTYLGGS